MDLEIKLAQISLPRLEKINTTMFWESGLLIQNERWLSAKLFLLHKMFSFYILNKNFLYFKLKWVKTQKINPKIFKIQKNKNSKFNSKSFLVLGRYIFQFKGKNTTIILYMRQKNISYNLKFIYNKIINQYDNKFTGKYFNKFINEK